MLLATAAVARAFDFSAVSPTGQTLYYNITGTATATLTSGDTKPYGRLTIPDTANGYAVTEIGGSALSDCPRLASVTIPQSVKIIGTRAFAGDGSLTSVFVAEGVERIGMMAFSSCTALDTLELPSTLTYIGAGFVGNTSLMLGDWGGDVLYVGAYVAAVKVSASYAMTVADSVLGIANDAFNGCHINHLTLPASLRFIGSTAFNLCSSLDTVRLLAEEPPLLTDNPFANANAALVVRVPCEAFEAYQSAQYWNQIDIESDTCQHGNESVVQPLDDGVAVEVCNGGVIVCSPTPRHIVVSDVMGRIAASKDCFGRTFIELPARGVYVVGGNGLAAKKLLF